MATVHSKNTYISVNGTDLSLYVKNSEFSIEKDSHDVTGYGVDDYVHAGGLINGTFTMDGVYHTGAGKPKAVLEPLAESEDNYTVIRRPEGTGSGKPQESFSVVVTSYVETNPYNEMIAWSCEMQKSGPVTRTTQG